MSQLFKLKQWLSLDEAATHLSGVFSEPVSVADVLRFGIDRHLMLSANFVNRASARVGRAVPIQAAAIYVMPTLESLGTPLPEPLPSRGDRAAQLEWQARHRDLFDAGLMMVMLPGLPIANDLIVQFDESIIEIQGIWDLTMMGAEAIDVEHRLQQETGGPDVELMGLDGVIVFDGARYAKIMENQANNEYFDKANLKQPRWHPDNFFPAGGLPQDAPLVVRTSALSDFIALVMGRSQPKPLDTRERTTLLAVIGALADAAKLDLTHPMKAGDAVSAMLEAKGVTVTGRTIGEHLKAVREAMDNRKVR